MGQENHNKTSGGGSHLPIPMPVPPSVESMAVGIAAELIKESMRCFNDYLKCKEHEQTERLRIRATLSAINAKINADKEVFLKVLNNNFEVKMKSYELMKLVIISAAENQNIEMLKLTYDTMLNIYGVSEKETLLLLNQLNKGDSEKTFLQI